MSESNYHGRMMNIAVVLRQMLETTTNPYLDDVETYKLGHRDARHAAAEIAAEADVRIAALEAQLAAAEAELAEIDNALWASMGDEKYDRAKRVNFLLREGSLKHQAEQQLAAEQERVMTFAEYEALTHRHDQLVAEYNETESDDALTEIAVIEAALYAAGYLNYGEEPFADDTPAAASEQEPQ